MVKSARLSVVVPAYDEAPNIRPLTERLFLAPAQPSWMRS